MNISECLDEEQKTIKDNFKVPYPKYVTSFCIMLRFILGKRFACQKDLRKLSRLFLQVHYIKRLEY